MKFRFHSTNLLAPFGEVKASRSRQVESVPSTAGNTYKAMGSRLQGPDHTGSAVRSKAGGRVAAFL